MNHRKNQESTTSPPSKQPLLAAFERMRQQLLATARKMLANEEDAEDALQDAFANLWSRRERIKDEEEASALLYVTTRNVSISTLRGRKDIIDIDNPLTRETAPNAEEEWEKRETFQRIETIIRQRLTPVQQKIIQMKEYEDRSYEEIARHLDMQPAAVRMQLSRARKTIRDCYNINTTKHE